jgi:hypothetical protein
VARYNRRTKRIVVTLDTGLEVAFPPGLVEGLASAKPSALEPIEISPSGFWLRASFSEARCGRLPAGSTAGDFGLAPMDGGAAWSSGRNRALLVNVKLSRLGALLRARALGRFRVIALWVFLAGFFIEFARLESRAFLFPLEHRNLVFQLPNLLLLALHLLHQRLNHAQQSPNQRRSLRFGNGRQLKSLHHAASL